MWMYTSVEPWKNFTNILFHNALYEPRLLFWQVFQLRLTGFLYYDLCAWGSSWLGKQNRTVTHKLIDGNSLKSPYISALDWSPMQSDGGRDVGDGKLMCECRHRNDRLSYSPTSQRFCNLSAPCLIVLLAITHSPADAGTSIEQCICRSKRHH